MANMRYLENRSADETGRAARSYSHGAVMDLKTQLTIANLAVRMDDATGLLWGQLINGHPLVWARVLIHD